MNILICDDTKADADKLARLMADSVFDVNTVITHNAGDALDFVRSGAHVDVFFLDVIMPEMNGIELARQLRADGFAGIIVFLSTTKDYAHLAFEVKAFQYLLKPPTPEIVKDILNKLETELAASDTEGILVITKAVSRFVKFCELSHVEVIKHIVCFRLINGEKIEAYMTFGEVAALILRNARFIQCHRSFIVNMNDIAIAMEHEFIMSGGMKIPISRSHSNVKQKYVEWMFGGD